MPQLEQSLSKIQIWMLAARPKTLPAAAAGVITGTALAMNDGHFHFGPALAALFVALLLQIGSNLANDVYDYERGSDAGERHGPMRVTQSQLLTPRQVKTGMWVVFGLSALLGLYLFFVAGWIVILIGLAAIISAVAYTGGPYPLGYYGLGDLFVFIFFGVAAVAGTYFVQAGTISAQAWWMSLPIGWLIVNILVVNNLRDIDADRAAGKRTLAVRLGERGTRTQYILLLMASYLLLPILALFDIIPWTSTLALLSFPLGWRTWQVVRKQAGRPLNEALAGTGQTTLFYSLLFFVGMILAK
jgi:1,4-dihydroxy-2-naphthoate octaprenyltransferase